MGKIQIGQPKKFFLDCLLHFIKSIASIYDIVTLPFYYYNQRVRAVKEDVEQTKSKQIDPTDPSSPWRRVDLEPICDMVDSHIDSFDTFDQMLERSFEVNAERPCYGYRKILEESITKKADTAKVLKQVRLDDYRWVTYAEFNEQIEAAMKGFLLHGVKSGDTVMLFADTRPEWQIASQALIRINVVVGTMYSTLGTDGIVHSINETQVTHIVTQEDIVDKLLMLKDRLPTLKTVIYFEPNYKGIRSKSSKIRAGKVFGTSDKTEEALHSKFFNRLLTAHKCDNKYTLTNGTHNNNIIQIDDTLSEAKKVKQNGVKLGNDMLIQPEIDHHHNMNGTANQHDLKGIISVKPNGITKASPTLNGLAANNPTNSTKLCEATELDYDKNHVDDNRITTTKDDYCANNECATTLDLVNDKTKQIETNGSNDLTCIPFSYLLWVGRVIEKEEVPPFQRPKKGNVAVIMYTSGSTGVPKGVVLTHQNIMATLKAFSYTTKDFIHDMRGNTVAAYLPLAHIFEFCIESLMLFHGVKFGFASPHTLTDKSPGLIPGEKGDLYLLKPTVMIIVPLILDRIVQGVKGFLHTEGYFKEQLVSWLIEYKIYWSKFYYKTPLIDRLVCSKIASALGGNCRHVICGSAPLSAETQQFIRAALNLKLPQGFGTTETCASTTCQLFDDQSTGNVGLPVNGALVKLESWHEGDYHPTDKPYPRGEIVVGGDMIADGYYKLEEQTKEAFYTDDEGTRWYRTGDIGLMLPNGNLKIIDRKKDLVKLQNGEYISLGKVESTLKSNKYLENFCAHANPEFNFIVAMGPVNELAIVELAESIVNHQSLNKDDTFLLDKNGDSGKSSGEEQNKLISDDRIESLRDLEEIMAAYRAHKNLKRLSLETSNDTNNNSQDSIIDSETVGSPKTTQKVSQEQQSEQNNHHNLVNRLCNNTLIQDEVYKTILERAKESNLLRLEIPKKVILLPDEWTAETGLVTAALKIRRAFIYKHYASRLDELYMQLN